MTEKNFRDNKVPGRVCLIDVHVCCTQTSALARLARIVVPGAPHHVMQRGNRRLPVFFSDNDRREYLRLVAEAAEASGTLYLAWCLMDNHIQLILLPDPVSVWHGEFLENASRPRLDYSFLRKAGLT